LEDACVHHIIKGLDHQKIDLPFGTLPRKA